MYLVEGYCLVRGPLPGLGCDDRCGLLIHLSGLLRTPRMLLSTDPPLLPDGGGAQNYLPYLLLGKHLEMLVSHINALSFLTTYSLSLAVAFLSQVASLGQAATFLPGVVSLGPRCRFPLVSCLSWLSCCFPPNSY